MRTNRLTFEILVYSVIFCKDFLINLHALVNFYGWNANEVFWWPKFTICTNICLGKFWWRFFTTIHHDLASTGVSSLHERGVRVIIWKDSRTIADNMCGDFYRLHVCTLMTDVVDSQKSRHITVSSKFSIFRSFWNLHTVPFVVKGHWIDYASPPSFMHIYSVLVTLFSFLIP